MGALVTRNGSFVAYPSKSFPGKIIIAVPIDFQEGVDPADLVVTVEQAKKAREILDCAISQAEEGA